tara:strand:- start:60 stop:740 length:681 start_codon:yes stop_codon:yes gene_type:complete
MSSETFDIYDCVSCKYCNTLFIVRDNNANILLCSNCGNRTKRSEITEEEMKTATKNIVSRYVEEKDLKTESDKLVSLNRELKKNSEDVLKLHNEENDLKIKQAQLAAKTQALIQHKNILIRKIEENKKKNMLNESRIRSPEVRQGPTSKKRKFESKNDICELRKELEFYKSVFKSHRNSLVSQVKIKTINGRKVWIDHIRDDKKLIESLDRDEEVEEWLKPIKAER